MLFFCLAIKIVFHWLKIVCLLIGEKAGEYHFTDMHWSAACVQAVSSDAHSAQILSDICDGVPDRERCRVVEASF
jgi:hypothetical protein